MHLVQDSWFGQHDERVGITGFRVVQQFAGGADEIRQIEKVFLAFRVGDHFGIGMLKFESEQCFLAEGFVHEAATGPKREVPTALALHPPSKVAVWCKQNGATSRELLHQIHGIAVYSDRSALSPPRCS